MFTINQNLIDDFADKINEKEKKNNKVTSLSSSSTHVQYPSAKAVYDAISEVEASSGGNYIYDFYHDSSTDDIVLEYDSASGGSGGNGGSCVTDFYIDSNTDEWVITTSACSQGEVVTQWEQTLSDEKVPSEKLVKNTIDGFVQYELSSSDYNPTIDSTITITCTCKNILGNPIANKILELMMNGVSQGTSTTNANGIATWTLTMSDWGNQEIKIENQTIEVYVSGFKKIAENTTYTLMVDETTRCCRIEAHRTNITILNGHNFSNYSDFVIPSKYYPKSNCYSLIMRNTTFLFWLWNNGSYGITNLGNTVTGYNLGFTHEWHY